jgi:hypothetical protein
MHKFIVYGNTEPFWYCEISFEYKQQGVVRKLGMQCITCTCIPIKTAPTCAYVIVSWPRLRQTFIQPTFRMIFLQNLLLSRCTVIYTSKHLPSLISLIWLDNSKWITVRMIRLLSSEDKYSNYVPGITMCNHASSSSV